MPTGWVQWEEACRQVRVSSSPVFLRLGDAQCALRLGRDGLYGPMLRRGARRTYDSIDDQASRLLSSPFLHLRRTCSGEAQGGPTARLRGGSIDDQARRLLSFPFLHLGRRSMSRTTAVGSSAKTSMPLQVARFPASISLYAA